MLCDIRNICPPVLVLVPLDGLVCFSIGLVGMVQSNFKLIDVLHLRWMKSDSSANQQTDKEASVQKNKQTNKEASVSTNRLKFLLDPQRLCLCPSLCLK